MQLTKWVHEAIWISEVKVIHWSWSKVTQIQYFKFLFLKKSAWLIETIFYVKPPWEWGMIDYSNDPGYMTSMAAMPYMVKTLKNILLCNQTADNLESWCVALGTLILPSLFKWWPWVDLDLFYSNVKFGPVCFCMWKKVKTMDFSETIVACDHKS